MKKALLIVAALMMISTVAFAGPNFYMGLYADEAHSQCNFINPGGFTPFTLWIYVLPADVGMRSAEFQIIYPANVISSTATLNPDFLAMGTLADGISVTSSTCYTDWVWTHHQAMYVTDTNPSFIELHFDPGLPAGQQFLTVTSCEEGYPIYYAKHLNDLALNQDCLVANEETSWGAIKDLYK